MRKWLLVAAIASSVGLGACERPVSPTYVNSSGSIALSRDDALIYAVDTDNEFVAVVEAATRKKIAEVKVGVAPETIVVDGQDRLYVANRGGRSVSVIHRGDWKVAGTIPVGVEPVGLAVSPDASTLYVVNATSLENADEGTLMAIDTASLQVKWELVVGNEPRGITLIEGGDKALVTLFKSGDVVQVDLKKPEITKDNTRAATHPMAQGKSALYAAANASRLDGTATTFPSFQARSAGSITASPDGQMAYMTVVWSREDDISSFPTTFGGYYAGGGPCSIGAVATAGLVTYEAPTATPMADDLTACAFGTLSESKPFPTTTFASPNSDPIQGPVASVVDPTGSWLFVLNRESQNVAILPTARRAGDDLTFRSNGSTVRDLVAVGKGANGIAISRDGKSAYVYNQFDHTISVLRSVETGRGATVTVADTIVIAQPKNTPFELGRELFFSALDPNVNNPSTTGVSCNTCHSEGGREDGHVWGFPDGKRQTPALVGRMMSQTAPFHWSGEFETLQAFMDHTAVLRMGGRGLTPTQIEQLQAYMDGAPLPDNPHRLPQPTDAQVRGAQVFQQAGCASCHAGAALTNNKMENVGTLNATDRIVKFAGDLGEPLQALNVPSLLGLARTAPYLHDGSAQTLRERITHNPGDLHGETSHLTEQQVDDLVEYLKTL